jgi:hypothetical protein
MNENVTTGLQNSGTDTQLRQVLLHLQIVSPADGDPTCQACGETIREGDSVTVYLFRPAGRSGYTGGRCRCLDHNDKLIGLFTLDTRELIVDDRIRLCRDYATQQTWPVLLASPVRLVSAAYTTTSRVVTSQAARATADWERGKFIQERTSDHTGGHQTAPTSMTTPQLTGGHQ